MKKFIPLSLLCLIFLFTSCSEEDSPEEKNEEIAKELIIGEWLWIKGVYEGGEMDFTDCSNPLSFNFYNDGTVVRQNCNYGEYEGEYLVTGNLLELEHNANDGTTRRMRATIEKITSEEMILDVEGGYLNDSPFTFYLEKAN